MGSQRPRSQRQHPVRTGIQHCKQLMGSTKKNLDLSTELTQFGYPNANIIPEMLIYLLSLQKMKFHEFWTYGQQQRINIKPYWYYSDMNVQSRLYILKLQQYIEYVMINYLLQYHDLHQSLNFIYSLQCNEKQEYYTHTDLFTIIKIQSLSPPTPTTSPLQNPLLSPIKIVTHDNKSKNRLSKDTLASQLVPKLPQAYSNRPSYSLERRYEPTPTSEKNPLKYHAEFLYCSRQPLFPWTEHCLSLCQKQIEPLCYSNMLLSFVIAVPY